MLRFTNRMCRFSICLLLLTGITIIGMRYTLSYELYICCLPLLWMIPWILLPIASYVVLPMEHMIQKSYVQDAKARLNACPQMIRVGISGSYGKTSVKYIAYALLKDHYYTLKTPHSYNNRMGITRTIREELDPLHEVFLCEMGKRSQRRISRAAFVCSTQDHNCNSNRTPAFEDVWLAGSNCGRKDEDGRNVASGGHRYPECG